MKIKQTSNHPIIPTHQHQHEELKTPSIHSKQSSISSSVTSNRDFEAETTAIIANIFDIPMFLNDPNLDDIIKLKIVEDIADTTLTKLKNIENDIYSTNSTSTALTINTLGQFTCFEDYSDILAILRVSEYVLGVITQCFSACDPEADETTFFTQFSSASQILLKKMDQFSPEDLLKHLRQYSKEIKIPLSSLIMQTCELMEVHKGKPQENGLYEWIHDLPLNSIHSEGLSNDVIKLAKRTLQKRLVLEPENWVLELFARVDIGIMEDTISTKKLQKTRQKLKQMLDFDVLHFYAHHPLIAAHTFMDKYSIYDEVVFFSESKDSKLKVCQNAFILSILLIHQLVQSKTILEIQDSDYKSTPKKFKGIRRVQIEIDAVNWLEDNLFGKVPKYNPNLIPAEIMDIFYNRSWSSYSAEGLFAKVEFQCQRSKSKS